MCRLRHFLAACIALAGQTVAQEEVLWSIESATEGGRLSWHPDTGIWTATGGVIARFEDSEHGEVELRADRLFLDRDSGAIRADGAVTLVRDGHIWNSEHLEYNFRSGKMEVRDYRSGYHPFHVAGESLGGNQTEESYQAIGTFLTTDDFEDPNLRIVARRMEIESGQVLTARHAVFYLGDVPVFYVPWLRFRLNRIDNNWSVTPGFRTRHGAYMLSTYQTTLTTNLAARVHLDYRSRRGWGGGPELRYALGSGGDGRLLAYYLRDRRPEGTDPDRFRFHWEHQAQVRTNLIVRAVLDHRGDERLLSEFFESEHREAPQPRTLVESEFLGENLVLSLQVQPRVNDFQERVERLPELRLSSLRQQVGSLPLYYEGESSIGYLSRRFPDDIHRSYSAGRMDTWHQMVLPHTALGWLRLVPRLGGRLTHYTETSGASHEERTRWVLNTGIRASLRASRTWEGVTNRFWNIRGLRHIVQPSLNHVYIPEPSVPPPLLPQFDGHVPSLLALPLQYPYDNAIDSVDSRNMVRMGLRQRLQTRRGNSTALLFDWNLQADWRPEESSVDNVQSELHFHPRDWIELRSRLRHSTGEGVRLADHGITFLPHGPWSLSLGHLHLRDEPDYWGWGNNVLYSSLYYRFNENWGARASHRFEARDAVLEEQSYTLYRDFRSWTGALSLRVRDERMGATDYTIAAVFSLKAAPRFGLGEDSLSNPRLYGR